jgi:hypothetical protein
MPRVDSVKIRLIIVGGKTLPATLIDGAATRDFLALLPLDLTLRDKGLVKLGHIDSGIETLASQHGEFSVRFERAE